MHIVITLVHKVYCNILLVHKLLNYCYHVYAHIKKSIILFEQNFWIDHTASAEICVQHAMNNDDFHVSFKYYQQALTLSSGPTESAFICNCIGNLLADEKNYQSAVEYYTKAIEYKPQQIYYLNRAKVNHLAKQYTNAINDYQSCLSLSTIKSNKSAVIKIYKYLIDCCNSLKHYTESIKICEKLILIDPSYLNLINLAYTYCMMKKYNDAENYIHEVQLNDLSTDEKNWYYCILIYIDFFKYKHYDRCIDHANNMIDDTYAMNRWKGKAYTMISKYDDAMICLNTSLSIAVTGSLCLDMAKLYSIPEQSYYNLVLSKTFLDHAAELYAKCPQDNHYSFEDEYQEIVSSMHEIF